MLKETFALKEKSLHVCAEFLSSVSLCQHEYDDVRKSAQVEQQVLRGLNLG